MLALWTCCGHEKAQGAGCAHCVPSLGAALGCLLQPTLVCSGSCPFLLLWPHVEDPCGKVILSGMKAEARYLTAWCVTDSVLGCWDKDLLPALGAWGMGKPPDQEPSEAMWVSRPVLATGSILNPTLLRTSCPRKVGKGTRNGCR